MNQTSKSLMAKSQRPSLMPPKATLAWLRTNLMTTCSASIETWNDVRPMFQSSAISLGKRMEVSYYEILEIRRYSEKTEAMTAKYSLCFSNFLQEGPIVHGMLQET